MVHNVPVAFRCFQGSGKIPLPTGEGAAKRRVRAPQVKIIFLRYPSPAFGPLSRWERDFFGLANSSSCAELPPEAEEEWEESQDRGHHQRRGQRHRLQPVQALAPCRPPSAT